MRAMLRCGSLDFRRIRRRIINISSAREWKELVRQILPADKRDKQTVAKCLALVKQYYSQYWKRNSRPYPGIAELLTELEKRGIVKVVFSNKPDEFTGVMVRELLPKWKFEIMRGALPDVPIKPDPTAALQIAAELKIEPKKFIYLGDSATDMQTANAAGMYAVGALWGFRTAEGTSWRRSEDISKRTAGSS